MDPRGAGAARSRSLSRGRGEREARARVPPVVIELGWDEPRLLVREEVGWIEVVKSCTRKKRSRVSSRRTGGAGGRTRRKEKIASRSRRLRDGEGGP